MKTKITHEVVYKSPKCGKTLIAASMIRAMRLHHMRRVLLAKQAFYSGLGMLTFTGTSIGLAFGGPFELVGPLLLCAAYCVFKTLKFNFALEAVIKELKDE